MFNIQSLVHQRWSITSKTVGRFSCLPSKSSVEASVCGNLPVLPVLFLVHDSGLFGPNQCWPWSLQLTDILLRETLTNLTSSSPSLTDLLSSLWGNLMVDIMSHWGVCLWGVGWLLLWESDLVTPPCLVKAELMSRLAEHVFRRRFRLV